MTTLVTTGPAELRAMLEAIGYPRDPDKPQDAVAPRPGAFDPVDQPPQDRLAGLLGLTGAVTLGDHLERPQSVARVRQTEGEAARHEIVLETLWNRRQALRTRVERRYTQAFEGTQPLPDAAAMLSLLTEHDALSERSAETLVTCAQKLGTRYRKLLSSTLSVVRRELHWLRDDTVKALRGLSPESNALIALDEVMAQALRAGAAEAHQSLEAGLGQRFAERLMEAVLILPTGAPPRSLDAWFKRRGWVARHLHECRRVTLAIVDLEWSGLRGLVDATCGPVTEKPHSQHAQPTGDANPAEAP